jgi:hypothetical protein
MKKTCLPALQAQSDCAAGNMFLGALPLAGILSAVAANPWAYVHLVKFEKSDLWGDF